MTSSRAGTSPAKIQLGHRLRLQGQERDPLLIVGVINNVRNIALDEQPTPEVYVPFCRITFSTIRSEPRTQAKSLHKARSYALSGEIAEVM